ncbi:MAG: DUF305 domain-containing protein [Gemmatimonadaceae bacterium]
MRSRVVRALARTLPAVFAVAACSTATRPAAQSGATRGPGIQRSGSPAASAIPTNAADVYFMSGMIPHHAQAVLIAGWAPSHGASASLQRLAERIVVGQRDEIELMQTWLRDRGQPVPAANATHMRMTMDGMEHDMLMPGMMTPDELAQLDRARGPEFDKLFLTFMIRHHEGAITMVDKLFGSHGAVQDETVFRFASDVYADQTTEIDRMQKMLDDVQSSGGRVP